LNNPKSISIKSYDYDLPDEKIAKFPLQNRDDSKLLVFHNGELESSAYKHLVNHLNENCHLVFNNTRVVQARLKFFKTTGAAIEVFCLEPFRNSISGALESTSTATYTCLVGNAKKWKGELLLHKHEKFELTAELISKNKGEFVVEFNWTSGITFAEILELTGTLPIPPYLNRKTEASDLERYQTVFASINGSVAAPTAGLHFTDDVLNSLTKKGIANSKVTLHVGAGTFLPVKSETIGDHIMHDEYINIGIDEINNLSRSNKRIVPIGTTSLRSIESIYWIAMDPEKFYDEELNLFVLPQWTPYEHDIKETSERKNLTNLIRFMNNRKLEVFNAKTGLMIAPGYKFMMVDGLITNFHQPKSTLLLIVSALIGKDWKKVYDYALKNDYRFLSYGDGCLLWNSN
tara:strand:+ start:235 stop:1443 length:1209 start_codon:yes stop_codon:yes gene_type:complete